MIWILKECKKLESLCVIPCGNRKIWDRYPGIGPTKAKNVYTGAFAAACRKYAERFYPSAWCIISAKHGFLFPKDIVPGPYNVTFSKPKTNPISIKALREQAVSKCLDKYQIIVVIAGKEYVRIVQQVFLGKETLTPLINCTSQGNMMSRLRIAREEGIPL